MPSTKAQRRQVAAAGAQWRCQTPARRCQNGLDLDALALIRGYGLAKPLGCDRSLPLKLLGCDRGLPLKGGLQSPLLVGTCVEFSFHI